MHALVITGQVSREAVASCTTEGAWVLQLELQPPAGPRGKPRTYRISKPFGTGAAAAYAAKARARELRQGVRVVVTASGEDAGRGMSVLHGVDTINTPDLVRRDFTTCERD